MASFDIDRFVEDCLSALRERSPQSAVREVMARAVSDPAALIRELGEPQVAQVQRLYADEDLTVLNVIWAPMMTIMPHNHRMWANIGVYSGREDNIFWRVIEDEANDKIEAAGAKSLSAQDVAPLGRDIIHSVTNPIPRFTGALHVYGGDFFEIERSEWNPETLVECPYDVQKTLRLFEDANARYAGENATGE